MGDVVIAAPEVVRKPVRSVSEFFFIRELQHQAWTILNSARSKLHSRLHSLFLSNCLEILLGQKWSAIRREIETFAIDEQPVLKLEMLKLFMDSVDERMLMECMSAIIHSCLRTLTEAARSDPSLT